MKKQIILAGAACCGMLFALALCGCAREEERPVEEICAGREQETEAGGPDRAEAGKEPGGRKEESEPGNAKAGKEPGGLQEEGGPGRIGSKEPELKEAVRRQAESENIKQEAPEIEEADWSGYLQGFCGTAVIYDEPAGRMLACGKELAQTKRSPCSTFKVVSSLIALESGILDPDCSTRAWSGETFWNEKWNRDIDFYDAFQESCVWYFRELADEIGQERMQEGLQKLGYGNCDCSDWEGRLNTNNGNRALTGFWIESSLKISPAGQAEAMARMFGKDSAYSKKSLDALKKAMRVEQGGEGLALYGKTGTGKADGIAVDAWFAGFAEREEGNLYFCVYLGRTPDQDISGATAREIAIRLVSDYAKYGCETTGRISSRAG